MVLVTSINRETFTHQSESMLCRIPKEILLDNILSRLTISEIGKLKLTCKSLSVLTNHPLLFKDLLMRDFQKTEVESKCKSTYQHLHKLHRNILNRNYHLTKIKKWTNVHSFKIEKDLLVGAIEDTLHVYNLNLNLYVKLLKGHESDISCLEVQDGKIYTGSSDHTCRIWDLETGECLHVLQDHTATILHLKIVERKMITAALDKTCRIWDLETGTCLFTLEGHDNAIVCLDATQDIVIAFSSTSGTQLTYCCQGWSVHSGECLYRFEGKGSISSVKIFDKDFIIASATYNYICQRRDLETGELKENFPSEFSSINCLEILDDLVIFGGQHHWKSWNRKTGEIVASEKALGHIIGTIRIEQGKVFTACSWSTTAKIWDLRTGKYLQTFQITNDLFANGICSLEIIDGKVVISNKTSCCIWDFYADNLINQDLDLA